jgi:hypothetical protein
MKAIVLLLTFCACAGMVMYEPPVYTNSFAPLPAANTSSAAYPLPIEVVVTCRPGHTCVRLYVGPNARKIETYRGESPSNATTNRTYWTDLVATGNGFAVIPIPNDSANQHVRFEVDGKAWPSAGMPLTFRLADLPKVTE